MDPSRWEFAAFQQAGLYPYFLPFCYNTNEMFHFTHFPPTLSNEFSFCFIQIIISVYIQKGFTVIIFLVEFQAPHQKLLSQGNLLYQLAQNPFD